MKPVESRGKENPNRGTRNRRPAASPEQQENRMVSLAIDLAEQQLAAGTASAQVITHFLKLGSSRERLEQERMHHEIELMTARREAIESAAKIEAMYEEAINAMRQYNGVEPPRGNRDVES